MQAREWFFLDSVALMSAESRTNRRTQNNVMKVSFGWRGAFFLILAASTGTMLGAAITPGDLVIYRVGDGSAALGTTATAVFLDEYTTAGSLVQSIAMPTSGAGMFSAVGNATTEG